jgi:chemotaxis protein methyltransferase CheR
MLHNANRFAEFLLSRSTGVTAMFRDPDYYLALRNKAIPRLRDLPFIRIWHAGCSTGEEVYSTAILLQEEDLYDRCRIYATDINEVVLETAKAGIFPLRSMRDYTANYLDAGGNGAFSEFYAANYNKAIFRRDLKKNIVFAPHNLVTDASINVFHIVACRNVMIYFNQSLQARVLNLLDESLLTGGVLGLGKRETIQLTTLEPGYETLDAEARLYRKVR